MWGCVGLALLSFGGPFLPSSLYLVLSMAGSAAQTGFALSLTHPGRLEGAEVSLPLFLSLLLKCWCFLAKWQRNQNQPLAPCG